MKRTTLALVAIAVIAGQALPAASLTGANLPGGTPITVDNTDPIDGTTFLIPLGDATRDIVDAGVATVGAGEVVKNTGVVYIMDLSDSMNVSAGTDCDGIPGNDSRLVCEKEGVRTANDAARAAQSAVGQTGIGSFEGSGGATCISTAHDVDLGAAGPQLLVAPDYDGDGNGVPDVEDVATSLATGGSTCYFGGLERADEILAASTSQVNIVIFMSDGINNTGNAVSTFMPTNFGTNTTVLTFALGTGVSCASDGSGLGSLNDVAATTTFGTGECQEVTDLSDLSEEIASAIGSTLEALDISVDGAPFTPIPAGDIDIPLPANGQFTTKTANYSTPVAGLSPGLHEICVRATGSDAGGTGDVTECKTVRLLQLSATPEYEVNELGVDNTHTVTAAVLGDAGGTAIEFVVGGQNAGAAGTCAPNPDCTTDAAGQVSFTYSVPVEAASLGLDVITVTLATDTESQSIDLLKEWVDTTPPGAMCTPTVNPGGKKIPQAPGKGKQGQNQDGFYELGAMDDVSPTGDVQLFVTDTGSGVVFGPFDTGTRIKYIEANGAEPRIKPMAGPNSAVDYRIIGNGDAEVTAIDGAGNTGPATSCLVPPAPK